MNVSRDTVRLLGVTVFYTNMDGAVQVALITGVVDKGSGTVRLHVFSTSDAQGLDAPMVDESDWAAGDKRSVGKWSRHYRVDVTGDGHMVNFSRMTS